MFDAGQKSIIPSHDTQWTRERLTYLCRQQDEFYATGATRTEGFRRIQLLKLRAAVKSYEARIFEALAFDLRKSAVESYMTEVGVLLSEITEALRDLKRWMSVEKKSTPLSLWPARSEIRSEPLGRCLILSPWNYPVLLNLAPLVAALAAGNVAVIKPSEMAPATSAVLKQMIEETFPSELVALVEGGVDTSRMLLDLRWDLICFTGGSEVGRVVAQAAARHLTPCILELGGKSPCIVSDKADIEVAARRIVWGKFLNAGQTCVAPDYILVSSHIHDRLLTQLRHEIIRVFGVQPLESAQLPRIVNAKHFQRLQTLLDPRKVAFGGRSDASQLLIEPTILAHVEREDAVMREEIFGPLLPVIQSKDLAHAIEFAKSYEKPLALYLFSEDKAEQQKVIDSISFGGGCINDVLLHAGNAALPFGGVGQSGWGSYHGIHGFKSFSHQKALVFNRTMIDPPLRYGPWGKWKEKIFRMVLH